MFVGLLVGMCTFLIIGILHPVVIKAEYYFTAKCWPAFAAGGILCCILSVIVYNLGLSIILAVLGFSLFWSIGELKHQEERVKKGWYPENPNRKEVDEIN